MSRSETNTPPADLSVTQESDDASPSGRVTMIHRPRKESLDSRDLPGGQPSQSNIDKVTWACLGAIFCRYVDGLSAILTCSPILLLHSLFGLDWTQVKTCNN